MAEIKREAGDKTKGFTLQKQRAISLFFDEIKLNPNAHINVAIEFRGDVYLQNGENVYVEEQKNYEETSTFSFNSKHILNTIAYFIEIWLSEGKSKSLKFGFYSTNKIGKEYETEKTKQLGIILPKKPILELVSLKQYSDETDIIDTLKKYLIDEYKIQYKKDITSELDNDSLIIFFNSINWFFEQDNEKEYDKEIIEKIQNSEFAINLKTPHSTDFVYASLMFALERKQDINDPLLKFLRKDSVELIFLKIAAGNPIDLHAYKYLNFEFTELIDKIKGYLLSFLKSKYYSNVHDKEFPELIQRKVARHNKETKIERKNLEETNPEIAKHLEVIIKEIGDLINSEKPTFLFGEIGSGKSTLLAHYFLNNISKETLPIFIPSTFLKGKVNIEIKVFKELINSFVNNELNLENKFFDLETVLLTKKEITLIIDGLDEFDRSEAQRLLHHLLSLSNSFINLRIIASGRLIELQEIVNFNEWNCLTTLDLTKDEILQLLKNEAIASGLNTIESEVDAKKRFNILHAKQELYSNATTPLVVCLIRDFLDDNVNSKTLGDILYDVVKKRLIWDEEDKKENFIHFLNEFPNAIQREEFISHLAYKIYNSTNGKINEDEIFQVVNTYELIPQQTTQRTRVVNDAINFLKNNFLQKIGNEYLFQSYQIFQLALGLHLFNQIISKKEFNFKLDYIDEWRIISFAGAISRRKGNINEMQVFFISVLDKLLISYKHTPATAILLSEIRNTTLNNIFLAKVQAFGFRPLMFWGNSDSLVPQSYAYIFNDVGKSGFDWFFENYINPRHPSKMGIDDLSISVLKQYFAVKNYELQDYEESALVSIIPFHIAARTYSCNSLIPTLVLTLPEKFDVKQRCILLAQLLESNIVSKRAEELLQKEWNAGNKAFVIQGLEIACRSEHIKSNALTLWFQLVKDNIPKHILDNSINVIAKGNADIFAIIKEKIGEENLKSYLRFSALNQNAISDSAALILYKFFNEKDLTLIGETIMLKTPWFDYKSLEREKLLNDIIFSNGEEGFSSLINHLPDSKDDLGIPEIYLKYFLKSIIASKRLYLNEFLNITRNLGKFSLSRYPEIRELFIKVLEVSEYYKVLKSMLGHLDGILRYNAATILLVCFPESEKEALEIVIRSSFRRLTDNQEYLRLCMKLNFSTETLDFIFDLLDDLPEISRLFAIKLLYHNNEHKLNKDLKEELVTGLLGKASFLDWSGNLIDDGIDKITANKMYFNFIKAKLNDSDFKSIQEASSNLIYHHYSNLNTSEKAKCWLFYLQNSEFSLVDFYRNYINLFDDNEFVMELKKHSSINEGLLNGKKFLLFELFKILKENGEWKDFFLTLLGKDRFSSHDQLEHIYDLLIGIGKNDKLIGERLGKEIKDLMSYPIFNQDKIYNYLLPQFAVISHEFDSLKNDELANIISEYKISQSEIACSLLFRLASVPNNYQPDRSFSNHIALFSAYNPNSDAIFNKDEIEKTLTDGDDIPSNLLSLVEWVLIKGLYSNAELKEISKNGNLATYFAIVISFSRNENFSLSDFFNAEEIGSFKYFARARTQYHKNILLKIKEIKLSDPSVKDNYILALIQSLANNKSTDIIDVFIELFNMKAVFEPNLLTKLFNALLEVPYRLNLRLLYHINQYILNTPSSKGNQELIIHVKQNLKAVLCSGNERHSNEYELLAWSLSLILLFVEGKSCEEAERGFLIGLRNVFIQDGNNYIVDSSTVKFKGRDLFIHSDMMLSQIDNSIIKKIIENGTKSNVPEISSISKLFYAFNN